jgi:ornithine lipid ester-linked acyl 2-hydroxylase
VAEPAKVVPHDSGTELPAPDLAPPADLVASNENSAKAGFIARKLMAVLGWIARKNFDYSSCGRGEFFELDAFPFVAVLEHNWTLIRGEVARLMMRKDLAAFQEASADALTVAQDRGWRTAPLLTYGFRSEGLIAQCPETWRLLQGVPGLVGAMFSVLEPGRFLPPHRGPYNGLLRLHLGLIVPDEPDKVAIRVADKIMPWEEGRALVFDDTREHEAWNDSDQTRVVLLVDFARPLRTPARLLNWLVLHSFIFRPFIREGLFRARWWERRLYREAQAMRRSPPPVAMANEDAGTYYNTSRRSSTASANSPEKS